MIIALVFDVYGTLLNKSGFDRSIFLKNDIVKISLLFILKFPH